MNITIIIPAYNEESCIQEVLHNLQTYLSQNNSDAKIIVVNDGSKDGTASKVETMDNVTLISHQQNKGYGAALKTGIRAAETEWVLTYDADNQHTPELISLLLPYLSEENDMVVGARQGYKGPLIRQPGKKIISWIVNILTATKVPDFNSGLRAFRRSTFLRYDHLFPDGFSLSTTSTVCFLKERKNVQYVPIAIQAREGKSTVRPRDAWRTLMLILRLIMLFSPLRIFLPISMIIGVLSVTILGYELIVNHNVSDSSVMLISLSTTLFFFGLISDQVAAVRRELRLGNNNS